MGRGPVIMRLYKSLLHEQPVYKQNSVLKYTLSAEISVQLLFHHFSLSELFVTS